MTTSNQCPFSRASTGGGKSPKDWWPNQLNLSILNQRGAHDPSDESYDYAKEFLTLDLEAVKKDILDVITTSRDFWPADYGHYGPFMIRMAWHSAGTYRTFDGRGGANSGNLRFAPLNSWPDNANLDKAKRLLWPIKQKYGKKLSWADLMILTGNVALESMGFQTFGFAGGRKDIYAPEEDVYWGPEETWLDDKRYHGGALEKPLGAVQMGLIYVNPQGPGGNSDPLSAAHHIRDTFSRMAMNDEETVALIAGGHTFGKAHGAADPDKYVGPEPEGAALEEQGLGWTSKYQSGKGGDTITSGLEGAWTSNPIRWDNGYFDNLFKYDWKQVKSPGGAIQWEPTDPTSGNNVPDAHNNGKKHAPIMFTTDLALRMDPVYARISKRFHDNPGEFQIAFAKAWYKLTHRDMGPVTRCLGPDVAPAQLWQDPVPPRTYPLISGREISSLKQPILQSGLSVPQLIRTAWASACTYRGTDHRGGANGARIRFPPQNGWEVNNPRELVHVLTTLERIQQRFSQTGSHVSMADLIVLAGCAALERAIENASGEKMHVPFYPGRTDALLEETDVSSFAVLEPKNDGFRNFSSGSSEKREEELLVDRSHLLTLSAPEMTVLIGGLRALNANAYESQVGVLTNRPGTLTNDFFVNLLDMGTTWTPQGQLYVGKDANTGRERWTASRVDLVFGSNSQLRAIAEYYACSDSQSVFARDFIKAWTKIMNLDRFDLAMNGSSVPTLKSRL